MNSELTGFVLAGGLSRRMRTNKAELIFDGKMLLEHQVGILLPHFNTSVVIGRGGEYLEHFPVVKDHFDNRGAPGGLHAALKNCRTEFAVVLAVDLPFVSAEAVYQLCKIALENPEVSAVVPRQPDRRLQPLFAAYRVAECLPALETLLEREESVSLRDFLRHIETLFIEQSDLSDDPDLLLNLNTPADFQRAVALLLHRADAKHTDIRET